MILACTAGTLRAQFEIDGHDIQIHGFASEGFAKTDTNNYLTMNTRSGSFNLADGGVNVSTDITNSLHVSAGLYVQDTGQIGRWHPQLDWAFADYRIRDWLGIRAGKVKTVLGLFNDTQDETFLYTWALLPQSIYPLDLRSSTIAHTGVDAYGTVPIKHAGSVSFTVYTGHQENDPYGGYLYGVNSGLLFTGVIPGSPPGYVPVATPTNPYHLDTYSGWINGADLRWSTPVHNLTVGASQVYQYLHGHGTYFGYPFTVKTRKDGTTNFYFDYSPGNLRLDGEYRRYLNDEVTSVGVERAPDSRSWYVSGAYRFVKRFEAGSYYSRYYADGRQAVSPPDNHIFDKVVTARIDLTSFWNIKIEGHFIDGYGSLDAIRGFYSSSNTQGLQPKTNMVVIRTGWNF